MMETIKMETNSLKGGDLPEDFEIKNPTINLENDSTEPFPKGVMLILFIEGARVRAQRVLRSKGEAYLKGKKEFTLKVSELFEKRSKIVIKKLTDEEIIDGILDGSITVPEDKLEATIKNLQARTAKK